ncbi:putative spore germination protein GerPA [Bacillus sp. THAF10]|uniref:spore germination protein n=1 Tax=Bacillus sp. THAF10 TaxID=2587848 RepID=UPI001268C3BB|nr:spore germination protein [Bacillus sp. THAF10]QFT88316.1 putative spore germination protein GerPA [Bacillus sp. THAF10]
MPAIVGAVNVNSIGNSGVFQIGDVFQMSLASTAKTFAGAGSFNTGDYITVSNTNSQTNTYDGDAVDQPIALNL